MFNRKPPGWIRAGKFLAPLDIVAYFHEGKDFTRVIFRGNISPVELYGVTLDDIHHYLKHGKPRKR
jgi:hypothetical protein